MLSVLLGLLVGDAVGDAVGDDIPATQWAICRDAQRGAHTRPTLRLCDEQVLRAYLERKWKEEQFESCLICRSRNVNSVTVTSTNNVQLLL
jgi:hypothetical protein